MSVFATAGFLRTLPSQTGEPKLNHLVSFGEGTHRPT